MTTPSNLLAELDAEFGRGAKRKPRDPSDIDIRKARNKAFHEALVPRDPLDGASAISLSWSQVPGWRAVARISWLHTQKCKHCLAQVQFIGNELTEFENKRLHARIQSPELISHDADGLALPVRIEEASSEVDYCASCLHLSRNADDLLAACWITQRPAQLSIQYPPPRPWPEPGSAEWASQ